MGMVAKRMVLALLALAWAHAAAAQSADDIVEKYLAAIGGRAALGKLKSRVGTGSLTLSTPVGEIAGSIEVWNAVPNRSRTVIKADLTALGAGQLVVDQRFDGRTGYVMDSLQGNRDMAGSQLENIRNGFFPSPFLNYKENGATLQLTGKEKVGAREAHVITITPKAGPATRYYFDAETSLPLKMVVTIEVPQLGQQVEQTTEFLDYRTVDGIKLPFELKSSSSVQQVSIKLSKVEHNVQIDETLFAKPAQ
jgi:outer membrane lipoprotein-sorting protein